MYRSPELTAAAEHEVRKRLSAVIDREASSVIRRIARRAVNEATDDAERRIVAEGTAAASTAFRQYVARTLPELASTAVIGALPDRNEIDEKIAHLTSEKAGTAVADAAAAAIPHIIGQCASAVARNVDEEVTNAKRLALASIGSAVDGRMNEILETFAPTVMQVFLPEGRMLELTGDSHAILPDVLTAVGARCHVLLVGPAGTGKSMLAKQVAEALGLDFQALSLGPTTPMSKVFGYYDANGAYHDTPFRRAFEHGGVMLLDELDNGHPGLLAELNQALALGTCAFADGMVTAHADFRLIATANTYGTGADRQYVGRQTLDAATLDRFVVVTVPIDERLEERIALGCAPRHRNEVRRLISRVRDLRSTAEAKHLPVLFSPRASIDGAKLLAAGATFEQVMRWRIVRGLSSAHRTALQLDDVDV